MLKTNYKGAAVYAIFCETLPRVYVGSSEHLQTRIYSHDCMLKNNKHFNKQLQEDYNNGFKFKLLVFKKFDNIDNDLLHIVEYCYMYNCLKNGFDLYNVVGVKTYPETEQKQELLRTIANNTEIYFTRDYNIKTYLEKYHKTKPGFYIKRRKEWYKYTKDRLKPRQKPDQENSSSAGADQE